jgi:hypothetical protein
MKGTGAGAVFYGSLPGMASPRARMMDDTGTEIVLLARVAEVLPLMRARGWRTGVRCARRIDDELVGRCVVCGA